MHTLSETAKPTTAAKLANIIIWTIGIALIAYCTILYAIFSSLGGR